MFSPNTNRTLYHFETDLISGTLQPTGHRHGIRKLIHKPTGLSLVHPDYSLLNLYLLFTTRKCLASARSLQCTATAKTNSIRIRCEPTRQHRVNLSLTYQLISPDAIDLTLTLHALDDYPAYEALLANYCDLLLKPYFCIAASAFSRSPNAIHWHTPIAHHQYKNNALIFPRDAAAANLHRDGRWSNVRSIYRWTTQNYYAHPIALQSHPEHNIAIAFMARPETCPSLSWTIGMADTQISSYGSDHLDDPHNARNPIYISLFGHDIRATRQYTAHIRLSVINRAETSPLEIYKAFTN